MLAKHSVSSWLNSPREISVVQCPNVATVQGHLESIVTVGWDYVQTNYNVLSAALLGRYCCTVSVLELVWQ